MIATLHRSKIPILCICNDKYNQKLRSLRNHCLELDFRRPTKEQIGKRVMDIARREGLAMNEVGAGGGGGWLVSHDAVGGAAACCQVRRLCGPNTCSPPRYTPPICTWCVLQSQL